ncbi:MAG: thioredoxin domain-containing protein [Acidimicrobiia bacterium]|nr:thioredoxin domain-containing protein [Acidimicrobiia bacterium]
MPNRLADATSPYLLQHKDNPVDWYEWGDEAFTAAAERDRPVLLSVGYSACHWCHVMAHESFEDEATAALMNGLFVNVKVDREERPDVDSIYMTAVQAMNGHGGWPMTVFLTPDGRPFFAGTYFPKEARGGMPSFRQVLEAIDEAWRERRTDIENQSDRLVEAVSRTIPPSAEGISAAHLAAAYEQIIGGVDWEHGGFGGAPKFPQVPALEFLLRVRNEPWADRAGEALTISLDAMAAGGIRDHLAGGFARYATDRIWLVPHFEKMLYDNALLARVYLWAGVELDRPDYLAVARQTLDYVLDDLGVDGGGLASAEDADSEGVEGKFYVFDRDEFAAVVGPSADVVGAVFGVSAEGNFEGSTILHAARPIADVADERGVAVEWLTAEVEAARRKLLDARNQRVRPGLDDKVITAWNGLALRALAEAGAVLADDRYLAAARANARFVLDALRRPDGRLLRSWRRGQAHVPGFLEDYAAYALGLLVLYEATGEEEWFTSGHALLTGMIELFWDGDRFFSVAEDGEELITRPQDLMDNPAPSGSSLAAEALMKAALLTGDPELAALVDSALRAGGALAEQYPSAVGHLLAVAHSWASGPREVAIVGEGGAELVATFWSRYRPDAVLAVSDGTGESSVPLLVGRIPHEGPALAYVCQNFVCAAPVDKPDELAGQLG